jgi:hypothetical protein
MRSKIKDRSNKSADCQDSFIERGKAAAKAMSRELTAEHKRWNMPLLSWKDGKISSSKS